MNRPTDASAARISLWQPQRYSLDTLSRITTIVPPAKAALLAPKTGRRPAGLQALATAHLEGFVTTNDPNHPQQAYRTAPASAPDPTS